MRKLSIILAVIVGGFVAAMFYNVNDANNTIEKALALWDKTELMILATHTHPTEHCLQAQSDAAKLRKMQNSEEYGHLTERVAQMRELAHNAKLCTDDIMVERKISRD